MTGNLIQGLLISLLLVGFISLAAYLYNLFWVKPESLRKKLQLQGINGPPPSLFYGNILDIKRIRAKMTMANPQPDSRGQVSHDYMSYLFPHLHKWQQDYGPTFMYSLGNIPVVYMCASDLVKELGQCKSIEFGRPGYLKKNRGALLGNSIVTAIGTAWVHQRKIMAPEFFANKVKAMRHMMLDSAISMMRKWEDKISEQKGSASIRVDEDLKDLAADMISKVLFGTYYAQGNVISAKIRVLLEVLSMQSPLLGFPGFRYIPIKSNRQAWKLDREISGAILNLIHDHKLKTPKEDDFLQVLIENLCQDHVVPPSSADTSLVVDNCKAMFFAGHETPSNAAALALVLLAHHPEWQKRARDEVVETFAGRDLDTIMLQKMKTLTMVIYETMRLYPALTLLSRETAEDMKFGDLIIPKGVILWIDAGALHQDPTNWGEDAGDFNPERFANGISGACKQPHLYVPFGLGIRTCLGQNFAMLQLKIVLSLILSKFTFSLSPDYHHRLAFKMTPEPVNGVHLLMNKK